MKYVDVILPLPLNSLFTYSIPETLEFSVVSGSRVLVPLGRSKKYIAIAISIHENKPAFKVRPILDVLDNAPVLYEQQYKMWQWISRYYLATLGDIYVAALPAGLKSMDKYKPKTETYIGLMQSYQQEESLHVALRTLQRAPKQQKAFI